ncbi:YobI family P-loop NTPase [Propioniciclava flava]
MRELNILLNDTPKRRRRRRGNLVGRAIAWVIGLLHGDLVGRARRSLSMEWGNWLLGTGVPLRFVYAVKDSLFEKLGDDTKELAAAGDATSAETLRANRTKFFDIVIPLVPFISHRNARELLADLLKQADIHNDIERRLQSMIAKHATDMRLMRNICNEYLVFAERLLESGSVAPGLDHSKLFALVAYKNFHLADFELISRGDSALDLLYKIKIETVRHEISARRADIRRLLALPASGQQIEVAASLGAKLVEVARTAQAAANGRYNITLVVNGTSYTEEKAASWDFWAAVAKHGGLTLLGPHLRVNLTRANLVGLMPEFDHPTMWVEVDEAARQRDIASLEAAIEEFRGADFQTLISLTANRQGSGDQDAHRTDANVTIERDKTTGSSAGSPSVMDKNFGAHIADTLASDLARDLVKGGFIDQNFTLYAAAFYGTFVGVYVANFMVHNVQPNAMTVDYPFTTPGAVENLLAEAGEEFLHTVAAFNVDIVDHLLGTENHEVAHVIKRLTGTHDEDAREFLAAFFTSGVRRIELAAELAGQPWDQILDYLIGSPDVPDDVRPALVSSALTAADPSCAYDLDERVRTYLERHYAAMPVFAMDHSAEVADTVARLLFRAGAVIPVLDSVRSLGLRKIFIDSSQYKLTAANLRTAVNVPDSEPIDLDHLSSNESVWGNCLFHAEVFLDVVEEDEATKWTVLSPKVLLRVLKTIFVDEAEALADSWTTESVDQLLKAAHSDSSLQSVEQAPMASWPALAAAGLFATTLSNIRAYHGAFKVDEALAEHLRTSGLTLDDVGTSADEKEPVAIALLNATTLTPQERVTVVQSLNLAPPLAADRINAEPSELFALLLKAGLVVDDAATFQHLRAGGWDAVQPAIDASKNITAFMDEDLLPGMAERLLTDQVAAAKVGHLLVTHVDKYLPAEPDDDNAAALGALARFARTSHQELAPSVIFRIAKVNTADHPTVLGAAGQCVTARHRARRCGRVQPTRQRVRKAQHRSGCRVSGGKGRDARDVVEHPQSGGHREVRKGEASGGTTKSRCSFTFRREALPSSYARLIAATHCCHSPTPRCAVRREWRFYERPLMPRTVEGLSPARRPS